MHLVGFIIRIYHDAWSPECQNYITHVHSQLATTVNNALALFAVFWSGNLTQVLNITHFFKNLLLSSHYPHFTQNIVYFSFYSSF